MTTIQVPPGAGRHYFATTTVPVDQPIEDSRGATLSVTQRHGVSLVGA